MKKLKAIFENGELVEVIEDNSEDFFKLMKKLRDIENGT